VGIYRFNQSKIGKNKSVIRSVFTTYLDMISFGRIEEKTMKILDEDVLEVIYNDNDKNKFR
jgi:hypothetical protein